MDESKRIREVSALLETEFMSLGTSLEKLPDATQKLVERSERLVGLASGQATGGSPFLETIALIEPLLAFIGDAHAELEQMAARLAGEIEGVDRMIAAENALHRAVAPLTYVRMNFKIESATLPHDVQQMFISLTSDIERLHEQVGVTLGEKFQVLRQARETIAAVHERLRSDLNAQGRVLTEKRAQVAGALKLLGDELVKKDARDSQIASVSRLVNDQIGRLVMSLQTQDIVSQKLAHVAAAFEAIQHRAGEWRGEPLTKDSGAGVAFAVTACGLQEAQLGRLDLEIQKAAREVTDVVTSVRSRIGELDAECLRLSEVDSLSAGVNGMVQVLLDVIEEVRGMMGRTVSGTEAAYTAIRPVGGMASNLTGVMRQLSAQIHLIALNAQVQAAHYCAGTGLEVLASGTAMISTDTGAISEKVASGVDELIAGFGVIVGEFERLQQRATKHQNGMESAVASKELALHNMRDLTLAELMAVGECVREVTVLTDAMKHDGEASRKAGAELSAVRAALGMVAEVGVKALNAAGIAQEPRQFADELSRAYSVASEHEVHRTFFGFEPASPVVAVAAAGVADVLFDDGFGEPAVPADGALSAVPESRQNTLQVPAGTTAGSGNPSPGTQPSLGDNVELF